MAIRRAGANSIEEVPSWDQLDRAMTFCVFPAIVSIF